MSLDEKGVSNDTKEMDPFSIDIPSDYQKRHPFRPETNAALTHQHTALQKQ
jgi:hypothetical protein